MTEKCKDKELRIEKLKEYRWDLIVNALIFFFFNTDPIFSYINIENVNNKFHFKNFINKIKNKIFIRENLKRSVIKIFIFTKNISHILIITYNTIAIYVYI